MGIGCQELVDYVYPLWLSNNNNAATMITDIHTTDTYLHNCIFAYFMEYNTFIQRWTFSHTST